MTQNKSFFLFDTLWWCIFASSLPGISCYIPPEIKQRWASPEYDVNKALKTIEERAPLRIENDYELYYASRYIDRSGHLFYRTDNDRAQLWEKAEGSWELLMGYEDPRNDQFFVPYPDFRDFAMAFIIINNKDNYFGKGIASSPEFSVRTGGQHSIIWFIEEDCSLFTFLSGQFVAMGGPSKVNAKTRQLYMDYQDFYINGQEFPGMF